MHRKLKGKSYRFMYSLPLKGLNEVAEIDVFYFHSHKQQTEKGFMAIRIRNQHLHLMIAEHITSDNGGQSFKHFHHNTCS